MVLLLPVVGGFRLLLIGQFDEAPSHGVGNICSKIRLCLCVHSYLPYLLGIGDNSGDGERIKP